MLLKKSSVSLLALNANPLALIERAGRVCYKSEEKITASSCAAFSKMILKRKHEAVIEHSMATFHIICDRGISHEIVRHRLASYCQESTRYCDYEDGNVCFIIPPWVDIAEGVYLNTDISGLSLKDRTCMGSMLYAESAYKTLRYNEIPPQDARSVLPNSLKTEIVMTANFREWRHFLKMRMSIGAHPQMQEIAKMILLTLRDYVQVIFDEVQ